MKIIIDAETAEYILKHDVRPDEVHDIAADPGRVDNRLRRKRYVVFGQTSSGRYLKVIVKKIGRGFLLRSVWDMEEAEKTTHRNNRKIRRLDEEEKKIT